MAESGAWIGHNGGPSVDEGVAWRTHCWKAARAALLPVLPLEVVKIRVARAAALGLPYRTYASVRAASGHDVLAFLFSSNALRVGPGGPGMPGDRAGKLAALAEVGRIGLASGRLAPAAMLAANAGLLEAAHDAPGHLAGWSETRAHFLRVLGRVPAGQVLLVGDMALEADWAAAGRLAGYVPAEGYFD